jgi:glutamate 5-kinase
VPLVESSDIERMVANGTATAGMIAKLRACEHALARGVDDVVIVDGQNGTAIAVAAAGGLPPGSTRLMATRAMASASGAGALRESTK